MREIGFDVRIDMMETAAYVKAKREGDFEIMTSPKSMRPDPDGNLYAVFHCSASQNWPKLCDPQLDALLEKQRTITNVADRKKVIHDILRYINEKAFMLNPYHGTNYAYWQPYVKGYYPHEYWGYGLKLMDAWLDK